MDMKKILQAFDGAAEKKPVAGASDMKKFLSIIKEGVSEKPVEETVISSFEAGTVGGDANEFLIAADKIQDEVMAQVNKIKINADEALLRDMMDKFNNFMTSYHAVGKDILQPDMFNDSMGESSDDVEEAYGRYGRRDAYQRDYDSSVSGMGRQRREIDDEANLLYIYRDGRLKQKMVSNHEERSARAEGFRDSQEQALRIHGIIRSKFDPKKWVQKQGTQWVQVYPFGKPEGVDEGKVGDAIKAGAKKVVKALTGPDDEELLQRLEKETGGKRPEKKKTESLSFKDYAALAEAKKKITASEDPCWKGYHMVGTKKKGGKSVPNCVPGTKG